MKIILLVDGTVRIEFDGKLDAYIKPETAKEINYQQSVISEILQEMKEHIRRQK